MLTDFFNCWKTCCGHINFLQAESSIVMSLVYRQSLVLPTKLQKVVAQKGSRRVPKVTSTERGRKVIVVCSMNAAGYFIPLTKQIHQWMTWYALVVVKLEEQKIGYSAMRVHHSCMKLVQRIVAVVNSFVIYAEDGSTSHCFSIFR